MLQVHRYIRLVALDSDLVRRHSESTWEEILPVLSEYISIPALSMEFDPDWRETGHIARAVELVEAWCRARAIEGLTVEVVELPERSPLIFMEIPPTVGADPDDTVLLYGHLDKQPEMEGWRDDGARLYGRGGADDGYAAFASITAIEAARAAGGAHTRCVVMIEASEESGSPDLPAYVEALADRIGAPSLVVCLDSGCLDYERMWVTTSLRGLAAGTLQVDIVENGLHSGDASGLVPSSFRIMRRLLDRLEDAETGAVLLPELNAETPANRRAEAARTGREVGPIAGRYPFVEGAGPTTDDPVEQLLARTWLPTLSVIGADGFPPADRVGNVLRPRTSLKLSFRLPPTCDHVAALDAIEAVVTADPPYGARVTFTGAESGPGWNAPEMEPWLVDALDEASSASFGQPARTYGEGGSIPFMGMLGERYPEAQFVITGLIGPDANAHGPNEYMHVPTATRLTMAIAHLLNAHAQRTPG